MRQLAAASLALACATCSRSACQAAVRALIASCADGCVIDLLPADDAKLARPFERTAVAHHAPDVVALLTQVDWAAASPTVRAELMALLRQGQPRAWHSHTGGDGRWPTSAADLPLVEQILGQAWGRTHNAVLLPLSAAGRIFGMLTLVDCRAGTARLGPDDLHVAQEVASKLALMLDNLRLVKALNRAERAREDFLSMASHALRTPLTVLTLQLQRLSQMVQGPAKALNDKDSDAPIANTIAAKLAGTTWQTTRLNHLVDNIVHAAALQGGPLQLNVATVQVKALCLEVMQRWQVAAAAAGCALTLSCPEGVSAEWDGCFVAQMLTPLLTNAIHHGAGAPIEISVKPELGHVVLRVADQGTGVSGQSAQRIFDNFERDMPTRGGGGMGMGLYISRHIAHAHGGTLSLLAEAPAGALFEVRMPQGLRRGRAASQAGPASA